MQKHYSKEAKVKTLEGYQNGETIEGKGVIARYLNTLCANETECIGVQLKYLQFNNMIKPGTSGKPLSTKPFRRILEKH